MSPRFYVTTAIPYVNAAPHIGHALEYVQVDVLARYRRQRGEDVRSQTGTDDNALKNVQAAEAAGLEVAAFVDRNAQRFQALRDVLDLSFDDFIRTSGEPRHSVGVERLWRACAEAGDVYQRHYEGLYCVGCEQFYKPAELDADGKCPEHHTEPALVSEENWFFRLSNYQDQLRELIESDTLRVRPDAWRNEVLSFIDMGLEDFSISRSSERAHGWGLPVPDDPTQIVYVWYDALGNYITALGYGTDEEPYRRYWLEGDERVHCIGKGILRFHAIYWPAMLLSAGVPLPTTVFVHGYLTVEGHKMSKTLGNVTDPQELVERYGADALRWWFVRDVPLSGDADFSERKLIERANTDLANDLGNLVNRTVSMVKRYRDRTVPAADWAVDALALSEAVNAAPDAIRAALHEFDFRTAAAAIWAIVEEANRYVENARPWDLAKAEKNGADPAALDAVLAGLVRATRAVAHHLEPFIPTLAGKIHRQLGDGGPQVGAPEPVFPRIETEPAA